MAGASIVVHISGADMEAFLKDANLMLEKGERYASVCRDILVAVWGAKADEIDFQSLKEGGFGCYLGEVLDGKDIPDHNEWVKKHLHGLSDIGLGRLGLTYEQYDMVFRMLRVSE